jgi:hypothetical protein
MAATFVKVHLAPKTESWIIMRVSAFYYGIKPASYVKHLEIKLKLK